MTEQISLPFEKFAFTLIEDRKPRAVLRMAVLEGGMYELHVEKGSAANPTFQFTREIPLENAQRFKNALQQAGVFAWGEEYGNAPGAPSCRWTVSTVFKEGVFAVSSKGGSAKPAGFDGLLEELYKLDFPRPAASKVGTGAGAASGLGFGGSGMRGLGSLSIGDLGAYGAAGAAGAIDFSQMASMFGAEGIPGIDASEMGEILAEAAGNPQALQDRMREEFRHMSPDEQNRMLDALAATGMASRAWWERFLRG